MRTLKDLFETTTVGGLMILVPAVRLAVVSFLVRGVDLSGPAGA